MMLLSCCLYLAFCMYTASRLTHRLVGDRPASPVMKLEVVTSLFFILFYSSFYILGYFSLLTEAGVVMVPYALAIVFLLASVAFRFTQSRKDDSIAGMLYTALRLALANRLVMLTSSVFILVGLLAMFGYPQGYEVSTYHLPNAVKLLQSSALQPLDGNFPHTFPANASIFSAFFFSFLPEKLVSASNLVFLIPLFIGIFALSRRIGADRNAALLVSCGLLSIPAVAFSSIELSADIGGLAFIVLAMSFVLTDELDRRTALLLAGASAGLAFGFKSMHLISIGFIGLVVLLGRPAGQAHGVLEVRQRTVDCMVLTAGILCTCGFWLVRNYLMFDNPVYPVNLPVFGNWFGWAQAYDVDFSNRHATQLEWVRQPADWLSYPWNEWHMSGQNFKHSSGLGAFFAASVPIAVLVAVVVIVRDGVKAHWPAFILLAGILFVMAAWWFLNDRQPRYAFAAIGYSMPLVAWMITRTDPHWRFWLTALLTVCTAVMLSIFAIREIILFADKIVYSGHTTRAKYYEYPEEIDQLPQGTRILNLAGRTWHYPLAGAKLMNEVVSMQEGRRLLGLPPSLGEPQAITLNSRTFRMGKISHIFATGIVMTVDRCMQLDEVGRLDRNTKSGAKLKAPRILYSVTYRTPSDASHCDTTASIK